MSGLPSIIPAPLSVGVGKAVSLAVVAGSVLEVTEDGDSDGTSGVSISSVSELSSALTDASSVDVEAGEAKSLVAVA